jgi:hypothetical protein
VSTSTFTPGLGRPASAKTSSAALQLAASRERGAGVGRERPLQPARARVTLARVDGGAVEEAQPLPGFDRPGQLRLSDYGGQVEDGAGGTGARDVVGGRAIFWSEGERAVDDDPGSLPARPARNGDLDRRARPREQPQGIRRRAMREDRPGPARQHSRHPPPANVEPRPPDRVHPSLHAVKTSRGRSLVNRVGRQPELLQLRKRDDAVLGIRQPRDAHLPAVVEFPDQFSGFSTPSIHDAKDRRPGVTARRTEIRLCD